MRSTSPTQFPGCLLLLLPCRFLFMASHDVFQACPAEMLPTLQLKTGRHPVLMESVQVRLVMFTTGLFPSKDSRLAWTACQVVESWYLAKTGQLIQPDMPGNYN